MTNSILTNNDGTQDSDVVEISADKKQRDNSIPEDIMTSLKFTKNLESVTEKLNNQLKIIKDLRQELKKLEVSYNQDINKVYKSKRKKAPSAKAIGFIAGKPLPNELAKIIGVPDGTIMSMPDYTREIYKEIKKRKLVYSEDARVFRVDNELKKVFDIDDSVNKSTIYTDKSGFNFSTLQGYLSRAMKKYCVDKADNNVVVDLDQ